jgi:hypothetical protein
VGEILDDAAIPGFRYEGSGLATERQVMSIYVRRDEA